MSDENGQLLFEKVARLLKQQQEMYGDFEVVKKAQSGKGTEGQSGKETEGQIEVSEPTEEFRVERKLTLQEQLDACSSLEELKSLYERSDVLKTDLDNSKMVFGIGNPNADLMIIGDAPGEDEDKLGEPFVGAAGQLLDKIMLAINFNRSDLYLTNVLKFRPLNNHHAKPDTVEYCLPFLLKQIELVDPKLILCLGEAAGKLLLGINENLDKMRRQFHSFNGREVMVSYHPSALLQNQQWKRPTWEDVQLLRARYDELSNKP